MLNAFIKDSHQASMNLRRKIGVCDWAVQAIDRIIVMATWDISDYKMPSRARQWGLPAVYFAKMREQ